MKQGSKDIPAIKFQVACFSDEYVDAVAAQDIDLRCLDTDETRIVNFEQVDGLTLRQYFDVFNYGNENQCVDFLALLDVTNQLNKDDNSKEYTVIMQIIYNFNNKEELLDKEISDFFEDLLITSHALIGLNCDSSFNPMDIIETFHSRYREGQDIDYVHNKIKSLKLKKRC